MEDDFKAINASYNALHLKTKRYLAVIRKVHEHCALTQKIGTHEDSAVDLATMINHTINTQLGGGA